MGAVARQRAMLALAAAGLAIAAYLTYVHYRKLDPACFAGGGGCHTVQASRYAELAGVPVAVVGLVGYATILATLLVPGEPARLANLTAILIGWGFSAYLTYRELFTIEAICQWCVASAVVMTLLLALALARLLADDPLDAGPARS